MDTGTEDHDDYEHDRRSSGADQTDGFYRAVFNAEQKQ